MASKMGWWGFELPNRNCEGTYSLYSFNSLPDIDIDEKYLPVTDLQKLQDFVHDEQLSGDPLFDSPTDCHFEIDVASGVFYVDQQGCVIWCIDDDGSVITSDGVTVAKSLPEFLARMSMENSIWMSTYFYKRELSEKELKYVVQLLARSK